MMEAVRQSVQFLAGHSLAALGATLAFFLGAVSAVFVVRHDIRFLTALPMWLVRRLGRYLASEPPVWQVALTIFLFNGVAMAVYLLMGLIPLMPAVIVFLTGMNIAVAGLKGGEIRAEDVLAGVEPRPLAGADPFAVFCGVLVLLIELPCFWFTMAMAARMPYWIGNVGEPDHLADLRMRLTAYAVVVLPLLALSALAEAVAVTRPFRAPDGPDG
jgi:hypothetical protein